MASKAQILSVEKGHYFGARLTPSGIRPPMVAAGFPVSSATEFFRPS
jgi:hypothetical protein